MCKSWFRYHPEFSIYCSLLRESDTTLRFISTQFILSSNLTSLRLTLFQIQLELNLASVSLDLCHFYTGDAH